MRFGRPWARRPTDRLAARPPAARGPGSGTPRHGEIVETLRRVVVEQSDGACTPEEVGTFDHLFDRGYVDSMGGLALLGFIEDQYRVTIDEADLIGRLHSLDALARHILASGPPTQP